MQERPELPQEQFIDDIPFYETQGYVRKILSTAEDYRRLYGGEAGLASDDEMPSVVRTANASDVDLSLNTQKKPAAPPAAKPETPSSSPRAPAKKRKRAA
jgi:soluble lytic murein transglycosylase